MQSTKFIFFIFFSTLIFTTGCIGDDVVLDTIEERLNITSPIDSLQIGNTHQFEAVFFNNIGVQEERTIDWTSTDEAILSVNNNGLATGIAAGTAQIFAEIEIEAGNVIRDEMTIVVTEEEVEEPVIDEPISRSGTIGTTSSYALTGDFVLEETETGLVLRLADNYNASTALPGLYVYLTNNPNTLNNAFEIGKVETFSGEHSYEITTDADLNTYSHVLYFCKPFGVKVGDGAIEE
jgi:ABC-type transport system substrate-binding protein